MSKVFDKNGIHLENCDCLPKLKEAPDNYYDLAICDFPYGDAQLFEINTPPNENIGNGSDNDSRNTSGFQANGNSRFGGWFNRYKRTPQEWNQAGGYHGKLQHGDTQKCIAWDVAPPKEVFDEIFRVSKNQIIWGGNYFDLPPTRCFVVWRKIGIPIKGFSMSPVEYAWTSFNRNAVCIEANPIGNAKYKRFHPTQKPVNIYEELLERFAVQGDKILDPTVGSAASLVACYNMSFEATGYEIDNYYFEKSVERLNDEMAQIRLDI